ncbi:MAG: esterase/lipase family protein [Candidatus Hermodarchaeota archaeon]
MKFNKKVRLKSLTLIFIFTVILILSSAITTKSNRIILRRKLHDEEINTSSPVTPQYRYHYEKNFDYYDYLLQSVSDVLTIGLGTEWSQDPNDDKGLHLFYSSTFSEPFRMAGGLFVQSHNEFESQLNPDLGGYVDFHVDVNMSQINIDILSIDLILTIFKVADPPISIELLNIFDLEPQKGRFYLPNFDQYIWPDKRIRFAVAAIAQGDNNPGAPGFIILSLSLEGLRVVQEIIPKVEEAEKRTLILAHGYAFMQEPETPNNWETFILAQEYLEKYDTIIVLNYADWFQAYIFSKDEDGIWNLFNPVFLDMGIQVTNDHSIRFISLIVAQFIINYSSYINDNVDFICHSMGGLVTRWMVKYLYPIIRNHYTANLSRNFKIRNVGMMGTPNHGSYLNVGGDLQQREMQAGSGFLDELNLNNNRTDPNSEIPWIGRNINFFTYRSGIYRNLAGLRHDGVVDIYSVHLYGATANKGWYQIDHNHMKTNAMLKTVIFNDFIKPPAIVDAIFNWGTPGIIIRIEKLTLEPNIEALGGKTLLSITMSAEDQGIIVISTVTLHIASNIYQMTLNSGSFEVELPLVDADYSFLITGELTGQVGRLYQMSGILRITDDDARSPEIELTPGDTSISDQDAIEGISIEWEISDYSGISEATVKINGVEIRSYYDQGTISDNYLLTNDPGTYTISVWARDNDNDPGHDPPGTDGLETISESTITIYDDDTSPPNIYSTPGGDISIPIEDATEGVLVSWEVSDESGLSEAHIELNGVLVRSYTNLANISDSYLLSNETGTYTFSIWAKDNDNDSENDWLEYSTTFTVTIYDDDEPPPPEISGYNILVLFVITSIVWYIIWKKRRNFLS